MEKRHSVSRELLGFVLVWLLVVGLFPVGAAAFTRHQAGFSFGTAGQGDGQLALATHSGVAINDTTGDVYVADTGNHRVVQFSSAGTFIRAFGANVGGAGIDTCTTGCVAGTSTSAPGGFESPTFVAIDNSGGASGGDVYVADTANNLISKFEANGTLVTTWGTSGQLNGSTATDGPFNKEGASITGVAVDTAGILYVGNTARRFFEFEQGDNFIKDFVSEGPSVAFGIAVNSAGDIYKFRNTGGLLVKLSPAGAILISPVDFEGSGMTVDTSDDDLYVAHAEEIRHFDATTEAQENPFGLDRLSGSTGLGVNSSTHTVYATSLGHEIVAFEQIIVPDVTTEEATSIEAESATLHGTISAAEGPAASCEFQYTTKVSFEERGFEGALVVPCSSAGPFTGNVTEGVSAEVNGLLVGSTYFFRLVGRNEKGTNPAELSSKEGALSFRTLGPNIIESSTDGISTTVARIIGLIETNGEPTTYRVEYGLTESYGTSAPIPDVAVPVSPVGTGNFESGSKTITDVKMSQGTFAVGQDIEGEGIPPGTTVTNIKGTILTLSNFTVGFGFETSLTASTTAISQSLKGLTPGTKYHFRLVATGPATSFGPDRVFSTFPSESQGGRAYELVSPARKLGEAFSPEPTGDLGGSCFLCLPGINDVMMPMQATADGKALAFGGQPFSGDLPPGGNQYISERSAIGWTTIGITPPLATAGRDDLESGFKAFSSNLSRGVLFQSTRTLSPEAPVGENGKSYNNLYLWEAGQKVLRPLVTIKPPNRAAQTPLNNGFEISFAGGNAGSATVPSFTHLLFEANDALTPAVTGIAPAAPEAEEGTCGFPSSGCNLYEWVGGTIRLVNVLPENETAAVHAVIGSGRRLAGSFASNTSAETQSTDVDHAISADGSRIFWSDESGQLFIRINGEETVKIKDSGQFLTATPSGSKVLLSDGCIYDVESEDCEATLGNNPSSFLGVMGASADLSRIYFLDTEVLAPGAQPESCENEIAVGKGCNLYVYDHGEVHFIAALNFLDNNSGSNSRFGSWKASRSNRTAQVSPDGQFLAFMSFASLTGYDNRVAGGGGCPRSPGGPSCLEVYEYDNETDTLRCPSCNPSGQRPLGKSNLSLVRPELGAAFPQPENLPAGGEGRLFFESQDALSPRDTNGGVQDVYEWTPEGVGGCERVTGCLALISTGDDPNDSMFVTATPDAKNAFFVTREQLVPSDKDELLDVYDARAGGGLETGEVRPCGGESCKGPNGAAPPSQPSSGSSQFSGPGNPKPRHPRHKKKRHKKKAHHKAKSNGRRGGAK